ncbi:SIMPL domain-containing protein [Limnobacter humi]|uniref:SIMPL domain-containing protein n=1 Tax=Limnobacter humi TaxID=1778671 RepID=A0ABT1WEZ2_9BURK|nr:SIMPL domain-containing protein [Limnobacter humi]MCQ8895964.1 SIMPL domain-containing protein [Limnobacter humi]
MKNSLRVALFPAVVLFTTLYNQSTWADACEKQPAVNLNASASEDVINDMVRLNWTIQVQGASANEAMSAVNRALQQSVATLSANKDIQRLRNNIQTYPQYGKQQMISTWQAVGTLSFEMNVQALNSKGALKVADGLVLSNLDYFPSEMQTLASRARLLDEAMKQFQSKADHVAKGFGKSAYSLGEISVNDEGGARPMPLMARAYAAADSMSKSVEVTTAPGSSQVSVSINGRVCLKP